MKKHHIFFAIWLLLFSVGIAHAETMYVRQVEITMRIGPGNHRKIIEMLSPGRELEVLDQGDGWANVLLPNGKEGWVLSRYLTDKKPDALESEVLKREYERLSSQLASLLEENERLKLENRRLGTESADGEATFDELSKAYDGLKRESGDFLKIKAAYQKAMSQIAEQKKKNEKLEKRLAEMPAGTQGDQDFDWFLTEPATKGFMYGAGAIAVGLIIGLIFGGRQSRRSFLL